MLDGPVDSIRWEMLRDGVEGYQYLVILKRLVKEAQGKIPEQQLADYRAILTVPDTISKRMTSFTRDPAPIEVRRHEIARAIEAPQHVPR